MTLREAILSTINSQPGIKGVELCLNVMGLTIPKPINNWEYFDILAELIKEREIVEVEILYRVYIKTIYFPKGTEVRVNPSICSINVASRIS